MHQLPTPVAPRIAALLATGGLLVLACSGPARAHGIESSLERLSVLDPASFNGPGASPTGQPARGTTGRKPSSLEANAFEANAFEANAFKANALRDNTFQLESCFSTGEPAQSATVRLVSPDGEAIVLGQTNAEGQLQFQVPQQARSDWEVQVDAGPGHRDYLELNENLVSAASSPTVPALRRPSLAQTLNRSQLIVGLMGAGLGAAGLLRLRRRHR